MVVENPKVYPDLTVFTMKSIVGKEKRIVGTKINDRTMEIATQIERPVMELIQLLDGTNSIEDIRKKVLSKNIHIDVEKIIGIFGDNGLLQNVEAKCYNEIKIISSPFLKINFKEHINKVIMILCKIISFLYPFLLASLLIVNSSLIIATNYSLDLSYIRQAGLYAIPLSYIFGVFHEMSHMIYAVSHDIEIDSIEVRMNLGVLPIVFVKYKGLYFIPAKKRLNLILSGIYFHIGVVLLSLSFIIVTDSMLAKAVLVCNIYKIIANLCPYQISDGYYALCTIFGKYNIRLNILRILLKQNTNKNVKWNNLILCIIYVVLFGITIVSCIIGTYELSFSVENIIGINHEIFFMIALLFYIFQWRNIIGKFKKLGKKLAVGVRNEKN